MKPYALAIFLFATAGVAQVARYALNPRWPTGNICISNKHDRDLIKATVTRVLTEVELEEVLDRGEALFVPACTAIREPDALKIQVQIRKLRASSVATKEK